MQRLLRERLVAAASIDSAGCPMSPSFGDMGNDRPKAPVISLVGFAGNLRLTAQNEVREQTTTRKRASRGWLLHACDRPYREPVQMTPPPSRNLLFSTEVLQRIRLCKQTTPVRITDN